VDGKTRIGKAVVQFQARPDSQTGSPRSLFSIADSKNRRRCRVFVREIYEVEALSKVSQDKTVLRRGIDQAISCQGREMQNESKHGAEASYRRA
jgi:hypothetical protein